MPRPTESLRTHHSTSSATGSAPAPQPQRVGPPAPTMPVDEARARLSTLALDQQQRSAGIEIGAPNNNRSHVRSVFGGACRRARPLGRVPLLRHALERGSGFDAPPHHARAQGAVRASAGGIIKVPFSRPALAPLTPVPHAARRRPPTPPRAPNAGTHTHTHTHTHTQRNRAARHEPQHAHARRRQGARGDRVGVLCRGL